MPSSKPHSNAKAATTRPRTRPGTNLNTTRISSPWQRWLNRRRAGYVMAGGWAIAAALATTMQMPVSQWFERHAQTAFWRWRGPVAPPEDVVIVAIDDFSLSQGELYLEDPENLQSLALLQSWPWPREAYAIAIAKIMNAGAKAVTLPLIFDSPSSYGEADDQALQQTIAQYGDRVVLGAIYEEGQNRGGDNFRLAAPYPALQDANPSVGFINFPLAWDNRIHSFGQEFIDVWRSNNPDLAPLFADIFADTPSLAAATLQAAEIDTTAEKLGDIFFYGSEGTFTTFSFADIIEPQNWQNVLQNGQVFQDKIVLIGTTSPSHKDFHRTAISEALPGVEVHANAIASLLENQVITAALAQPWQQGLLVVVIVMGGGVLICWPKNGLIGLGIGLSLAIAWGSVSYTILVRDRAVLPIAMPSLALMLTGASYSTLGAIRELYNKRHLRRTFKHYASSPIIQEIISQQDDLQDLLQEREYEMLEMTLAGRYRVVAKLSSGGFGETYIAEDSLRPGNPRCVVKKLQPQSDNPKHWQLAERLFLTEAQTLERLGKHEQIPQLLAYFEEGGEFYLVEELIVGRALGDEWPVDVPLSEVEVVAFLRDFLPVLEFIHAQGAIHRDIKPDNIIRRKSDDSLVLIDFGAVKEMQTVGEEDNEKTVAIGTRGYAPREQIAGSPRFNSDIYAVGMLAVHGLTLLHPAKLPEDPETGEIAWRDKAVVSEPLAAIVDRMIKSDFRDRPPSATAVLEELQTLIADLPPEMQRTRSQTDSLSLDATTPWIDNTQIDSDVTAPTAATAADLATDNDTPEEDATLADMTSDTDDETVAFQPQQSLNNGEDDDETLVFNLQPPTHDDDEDDETIAFNS